MLEEGSGDSSKLNPYPIRFFQCGEYGDQLKRPHHHACLFNFDFADKEVWSVKHGVTLYRSKSLERLWPHGYSLIGEVTYESAAYVARYITKKINGEQKFENYSDEASINRDTGEVEWRRPEYITMSRRPGIGAGWFLTGGADDCFPKDFVTVNGKKFKIPEYYDRLYDEVCLENMQEVKEKRRQHVEERLDSPEYEQERLNVKKRVAERAHKVRERKYENGSTML